jgi:hypothetical protein
VLGENHRIMSRAARHAAYGRALAFSCLGEDVLKLGIERRRLLPVRLGDLELELLLVRHALERLAHEALGTGEGLRVTRPHVDRELGGAGDHVEAAGGDREDPDVRGHGSAFSGFVAQSEDDTGGPGERVSPRRHGRRAGVVRLPCQPNAEAEQSGDGRHDPDVDSLLFEHGALLDVQLEVGADPVDPARLGQPVEVEPCGGHRIGDSA